MIHVLEAIEAFVRDANENFALLAILRINRNAMIESDGNAEFE